METFCLSVSAPKIALVILNLSPLEWENCNFCHRAFGWKRAWTNGAFANPICRIPAWFQTDLVPFTCSKWTLHTPVLQTLIYCVFRALVQHCIIRQMKSLSYFWWQTNILSVQINLIIERARFKSISIFASHSYKCLESLLEEKLCFNVDSFMWSCQ